MGYLWVYLLIQWRWLVLKEKLWISCCVFSIVDEYILRTNCVERSECGLEDAKPNISKGNIQVIASK